MASDAQQTLYRIFAGLAGAGAGSVGGTVLGAVEKAATGGATSKQAAGGGAGSIALDVLKSGLGLAPLATTLFGLFGLFGGGESDVPPPLTKYGLPPSIRFDAVATPSGLTEGDYDQAGMPRAFAASAPSPVPAPQVNVTVQAMDARSFLDRSSEIAAAVREAMLNLNSINDVVNEL